MKLLINICGQDGIVSHNSGVGTMVKRYIESFLKLLTDNSIKYTINLFTPEYHEDGFGYSKETFLKHNNDEHINIFQISNGSNGTKFFGKKENWVIICNECAKIINKIKFNEYDYVITLANDTPFANIINLVPHKANHYKIWIPHSTVLIHNEENVIAKEQDYIDRLNWELECVKYINENDNCYVGVIGDYLKKHILERYNLIASKTIDIYNGEIINSNNDYVENEETIQYYDKLKLKQDFILTFGRPEAYKNLEASINLAKYMNMPVIIATQEYYQNMPYVNYLKSLSNEKNCKLIINGPFNLPQYIINHYNGKIIIVIPSKKEVVGLIINEIRKFNKNNILLVSNSTGGLTEQINDTVDGLLIDIDNIDESAKKITKYFNEVDMHKLNENSQKRLIKDYNLNINIINFINKLIEVDLHE